MGFVGAIATGNGSDLLIQGVKKIVGDGNRGADFLPFPNPLLAKLVQSADVTTSGNSESATRYAQQVIGGFQQRANTPDIVVLLEANFGERGGNLTFDDDFFNRNSAVAFVLFHNPPDLITDSVQTDFLERHPNIIAFDTVVGLTSNEFMGLRAALDAARTDGNPAVRNLLGEVPESRVLSPNSLPEADTNKHDVPSSSRELDDSGSEGGVLPARTPITVQNGPRAQFVPVLANQNQNAVPGDPGDLDEHDGSDVVDAEPGR